VLKWAPQKIIAEAGRVTKKNHELLQIVNASPGVAPDSVCNELQEF
jgi:hypothetical protein